MSDDGAGPSSAKRARNSRKVYKFNDEIDMKELEKILMDSDEEEVIYSESDEEFLPDSSKEESSEDDEITDTNEDSSPLEEVVTKKIPAKERKIVQPLPPHYMEDDVSSMKTFNFTKAREILVQPQGDSPIDFFNMLVDENFYKLIVEETNIYAEEVFLNSTLLATARISRWHPVTADELRIFFGLFLHMGTISLNRLQDYWKTNRLFSLPFFAKNMSRDRFLLIMRCLHFARNPRVGEKQPEDRLFKLRPLIDYFNNKMAEVYYPGQNLSLDESMVLWRGRLSFRQYIKNKRHKYGVKLYVLTEPDGTILKFAVYTGQLDDFGGTGHAANVVLHLMEGFLDSGHSLYMDNFYNSYDLALKLLIRNTYCTGTLRIDRKNLPAEVKTQKLKKGETIYRCSDDGVLVGKWRDRREVSFITTEFPNDMVTYRDKLNREKEKPKAIYEYNKFMGGVDRQDQLMAYYPCERKSLRWYKKLGFHILHMLLVNAYLLYKKKTNNKMSLYDFRINIIENLVPEKPQTLPTKNKNHTPLKNPVGNNGRVISRRCTVCYNTGKIRKETTFHCGGCENQPYLCIGQCFETYHAKMK